MHSPHDKSVAWFVMRVKKAREERRERGGERETETERERGEGVRERERDTDTDDLFI